MTSSSPEGARPADAGRAPSAGGDGTAAANGQLLELRGIGKSFGPVQALTGIDLDIPPGKVTALVGDNGAGKSTLIKTVSGIWEPSAGHMAWQGRRVNFRSPRDATETGIATVYQDLALVPLMSVARNFFMGREPTRRLFGALPVMDHALAERTAAERLAEMGIRVRDASQLVGNMSGGEKQCLAIARAIHFGARVLILDEPTAALGVKQSVNVLKLIAKARLRGISVIFITHNVNHAYPIGDRFTLLNRGKSMGTHAKTDVTKEAVLDMMAGGAEMQTLMGDLEGVTI